MQHRMTGWLVAVVVAGGALVATAAPGVGGWS